MNQTDEKVELTLNEKKNDFIISLGKKRKGKMSRFKVKMNVFRVFEPRFFFGLDKRKIKREKEIEKERERARKRIGYQGVRRDSLRETKDKEAKGSR